MCESLSVSKEHVPPKCFFPEQKDIPTGMDYRKNLVTVPSCREHNMRTSKDDEYLLAVVITHYQNNQAAYNHFMSKILRGLNRNSHLAQRIVKSSTPIVIGGQSTAILNAESERINSELKKIACGIYYHHFGKKWAESIMIDSPSRLTVDESPEYSVHHLAALADQILQHAPTNGDNPDIFYYQALSVDALPVTIIKMVFYGGFKVFAFSGRAVEQGLAHHVEHQQRTHSVIQPSQDSFVRKVGK
jgi:hypothetical protein